MKKIFLTILLVLSLTVMLYAEDSSGDGSNERVMGAKGFDWDIRFGFSLPFVTNISSLSGNSGDSTTAVLMGTAGAILSPLIFSSLSIGASFQYTVIPHLLAPGIYVDMHFNLPSWFIVSVFSDWKYNLLLLQPGIRVYNQFQFTNSFGLEPFVGVNFMYIGIPEIYGKSLFLMDAGFVMKLGSSFGLEYCFIIPSSTDIPSSTEDWTPSIHRLGFSWSLR